jgi:hypothetical protein
MARRWDLGFILSTAVLLLACGGGVGGSNSGAPANTPPADTTKPTVISTNPAHLSSGVPLNATLTASFSENLDPLTPGSAFSLTQGAVATPGTFTVSGAIATFTPTAKLGPGLSYSATLTTAVKDLAGNTLAAPFTWSFITGDCSAITLVNQVNLGAVASGMGFKCLATDGTSIYLYLQDGFTPPYGTLLQIHPVSGAILATTNIPLVAVSSTKPGAINFIADIAWHGGALWASGSCISAAGAISQSVFKVNLTTGLAENQTPTAPGLAGEVPILQGLASDGVNLYAAIDRNFQFPTPVEHVIVKFNPATSTQVPLSPALLKTAGQATRLDCGGGFLFVFNNPNVQKADPATGAVVANFCKNDGGANILYLNNSLWSIKDTVLFVYSFQ